MGIDYFVKTIVGVKMSPNILPHNNQKSTSSTDEDCDEDCDEDWLIDFCKKNSSEYEFDYYFDEDGDVIFGAILNETDIHYPTGVGIEFGFQSLLKTSIEVQEIFDRNNIPFEVKLIVLPYMC